MRIAMDIREACKSKRTGKGQWASGLLAELVRREVPVLGFVDGTAEPEARGKSLEIERVRGGGLLWHWRVARRLRQRGGANIFVSPTSYIVPSFVGKSVPVVPIVHDLIAFRGEPHDRRAVLIERMTLGRAVRGARHICTVSDATKQDLLARYPQLLAEAVTPIFAGPLRAQAPQHRPDGRTILCIGTLSPRKNQKRLIEAFALLPAALRQRTRLVLAGGRGWMDREIVRLASETAGVEWRGYVPEGAYEELLSTCTVFALPSLYEGFGMQVLDALQRGIPILTSDRGSLREVCGNAAHYVDPESVPSIAAGLQLLLENDRVRFDLGQRATDQAREFSWERTADLLLEALERVR